MKKISILVIILSIVLLSSCNGTKANDIYEFLYESNIQKTEIIKIYKPKTEQDIYICLYEQMADGNIEKRCGGLLLVEKNLKTDRYQLGYSQSKVYDVAIDQQTFFTYYFNGPDKKGSNHNFVIGGRFKSDYTEECKPYIEFMNGDILLIENYKVIEGSIFFYVDIGNEYIVEADGNETKIMQFELKTICK